MKAILKYIILVSLVGVLQMMSAICINKSSAVYIWIAVNAIGLIFFAYRFLYYRSVIGKYLSLNLRYLGNNYKQPFLIRSFIGKSLLAGQPESNFTDVKALTTYKYFKILQVLGGIFLAFAIVAAAIIIVRYIK